MKYVIICYAISIILVLTGIFLHYRNNNVFSFRYSVIELVFKDSDYEEKLKIYDRVSYDKMVWSFKPLKLESFYTKEEIAILNR